MFPTLIAPGKAFCQAHKKELAALAHIVDGVQALMIVGMDSNAQKPVIAFSLALLRLLATHMQNRKKTGIEQVRPVRNIEAQAEPNR